MTNQTQTKIDFFTITKKYWKEQIFFYILNTLSCLMAVVLDENALGKLWDKISKNKWTPNFKFLNKTIIRSFPQTSTFLIFIAILTLFYSLIVKTHVFYGFWLENKISRRIKIKLMRKFFHLSDSQDHKKTLALFNHDIHTFAKNVVFVPNQVYYIFLSTTLSLYIAGKNAGGNLVWWGAVYLALILATTLFLEQLLYKKDLKFRRVLEQGMKKEDLIINNQDLIIKKGLILSFQNEYKKIINRTSSFANKRDLFYTLSFVIPSYLLITYSDFVFLPLLLGGGGGALIAMRTFSRIFNGLKKSIERLRDYPYYFSAKKRLNNYFSQAERDDIQKNILISEPVENINLQQVNFAYQPNHWILQRMNLQFSKGEINHLRGTNGYGKSTIISLIMGLHQPQQGEILINNKYKLNEINLIAWREKIAYSEHRNLIENGLSTGQKQLTDLNNVLTNSEEKEVFIFDEADNSLDENNKKNFWGKLTEISRKKVVILISH